MKVRPATRADATCMSRVLEEIKKATGRRRASDPSFVLAQYLEHPDRIECSVAVDEDDHVMGFQSLRRATEANPYGVQVGWGIIGTHVSPRAARRGVGAALFEASLKPARNAGLPMIDATIGEDNDAGLAYYEAMGFRTYRMMDGASCKAFRIK